MLVILDAFCPAILYMFKFHAPCIIMHDHDSVQFVEFSVEDDGSIAPLLLIIAGTVPGAGHGVRVAVCAGSIGHGHTFVPEVQVGSLVMVPGPVAT